MKGLKILYAKPGARMASWGLLLLLFYGILHLAGFRSYTDAISGMHGASWRTFAGLLYMLTHLLTVFIVPPVLGASLLVYAISTIRQRRSVTSQMKRGEPSG